MEWKEPIMVFVYGYGACFVCLTIIMLSIMVTRKVVGTMQRDSKKSGDGTSKN